MKKRILKKSLAVFMALGIAAAGLTGCGDAGSDNEAESTSSQTDSSAEEEKSDSEELKTLKIGVGGSDGNGIFEGAALAVKNGYFEEELKEVGFTPEYVYFTNAGPEINEAFAAKEIDAAIVGDFPAFTAKSNGIDNTIIATVNQKNQYGILVASDDVKEPKDLEGKRLILPQGTVTQFFWENYAEANGIDTDKVELINAASDASSLLQTGEADAYAITRYVAEYMSANGLGTVLSGSTDNGNIYTTFIFEATSQILEDNPQLGVAVNKALIRSYEAAVADPDSLYEALKSDNITADAWRASYSFDDTLSFLSPEITEETMSYYNSLTDWMVEHSIVSDKVDVDSFVDTSYYEKAVSELN